MDGYNAEDPKQSTADMSAVASTLNFGINFVPFFIYSYIATDIRMLELSSLAIVTTVVGFLVKGLCHDIVALTFLQVQDLLQQMQSRFQAMSDSIVTKIDDMGTRIDELEQSINDLKTEMGMEGSPSPTASSKPNANDPKPEDGSA